MEKNSFNKKKPIIFIPARKGSKGLPFKNRLLLQYTLQAIPDEFKENIIVSTDDEKIINICEKHEIKFDKRDTIFAEDDTSMKDVLLNFKKLHPKLKEAQEIIMLYLTYPQRKWEDLIKAYNFFTVNKTKSLLCKKNINTHPYLMLVDNKNNTGRQLVKHDLYRRQEYPNVFELSHFIAIMIVGEIKNLNKNLYNKDTQFFQIEDKIDVDTIDDLKKFNPDPKLGKKRVLILGNDKSLNDLKGVKFKDDITVVGINRSHEIIKSDYLFFNDFEIFAELYKKERGDVNKVKNYNTITSRETIISHIKSVN
jgi:CMP-N-acetylneuraminic acid synthetase